MALGKRAKRKCGFAIHVPAIPKSPVQRNLYAQGARIALAIEAPFHFAIVDRLDRNWVSELRDMAIDFWSRSGRIHTARCVLLVSRVRGGKVQTVEGEAPKGYIVVIAFDSVEKARGSYCSPAYEAIKLIRRNSEAPHTHRRRRRR
jgi:uncharacterized protein (DUF1330 family)